MSKHAVAYGGFANTVREPALKVDSGRKLSPLQHQGIEPAAVVRLTFWTHAIPTRLSRFCLFKFLFSWTHRERKQEPTQSSNQPGSVKDGVVFQTLLIVVVAYRSDQVARDTLRRELE